LFDYYGFPREAYQYTYNAPGSPQLAHTVRDMLQSAGLECKEDSKRGWDHGVFVPLKLLYPNGDIPVVALSLQSSLDPQLHIRMGEALQPLRRQGVLIVGSGASFHNFDYFFARDEATRREGLRHSHIWNTYLEETFTSPSITSNEKLNRLINWFNAPSAREAHKKGQEEHLIPLHVLYGAGKQGKCRRIGGISPADEIAMANFEWSESENIVEGRSL